MQMIHITIFNLSEILTIYQVGICPTLDIATPSIFLGCGQPEGGQSAGRRMDHRSGCEQQSGMDRLGERRTQLGR